MQSTLPKLLQTGELFFIDKSDEKDIDKIADKI